MDRSGLVGLIAVAAASLAALASQGAHAQVEVVSGGEMSRLCSLAANSEARNAQAIDVCTQAIDHEAVLGRDLAGLYVDRGVLRLREGDLVPAERDFDIAISIAPGLGEAWVDRGGARIAQRLWREGIADVDHGLVLKPREPQKAYYNRAIAEESLGDLAGAYRDYQTAAALAPWWGAPRQELTRFSVRPAG